MHPIHDVPVSNSHLMIFSYICQSFHSRFFTKNGEPLYIDGPQSFEDRIAVVVAGASGIDMATRLKKMGFTNIDIYESDKRVGGKSMSIIDPQGTVQELGSCCIGPGYENNILQLI